MLLVRTRQLRIGCQHSTRVSGHLYLRHNRYATLCCIRHEVAQLLLRVESAVSVGMVFGTVRLTRVIPCAPFLDGAVSHAVDEARIAFYLHTPTLCVGEMQMQAVEFILRHDVNLAFYEIYREEMAHHIEHQTAPLVRWLVSNIDTSTSTAVPQSAKRA